MEPVRVGILGCGNVLSMYLDNASLFPEFDVVAVADLNQDLAKSQAERFGVPTVLQPDELVAHDDVELIVNLTPPAVHAGMSHAAIAAGKHVFTEKPFAPTLPEAGAIMRAAKDAGVSVSVAPVTFLGGGLQTTLKLIDDGWIGTPVAATASFTCRGYEHWHPNIDPFYSHGGGPMLDIGPYLITTLISIFGPARRVSASAQRFSETRPRPNGLGDISVDVMTHVSGTIDFHSGAVATVVTSWEMWAANLPHVEIYGTTGTIGAPNPDHFTGLPNLRRGEARDLSIDMYPPGGGDWRPMPMTHRGDIGRSLGIAEMAHALRTGTKSRSDMEFGYHALEVMLAFEQSSSLGQHVDIVSTCDRPASLPPVSVEEPVRFD